MGKFVFRLEPVLRQRGREEQACQRRLAQLLGRRQQMHEQLRRMQGGLSSDKQAMAASLVGHVDVSRIRMHAAHNAQVTHRAHAIVRELAELEDHIEQARAALLETTRQRKAIELLRDRQWQRWQKTMARREAAAADEMATQRYGRRQVRGATAGEAWQ